MNWIVEFEGIEFKIEGGTARGWFGIFREGVEVADVMVLQPGTTGERWQTPGGILYAHPMEAIERAIRAHV